MLEAREDAVKKDGNWLVSDAEEKKNNETRRRAMAKQWVLDLGRGKDGVLEMLMEVVKRFLKGAMEVLTKKSSMESPSGLFI
ncbi:hypothetical protein OIU77_012124 [Salix suchowensis]|uniref:Uncharacterized protein n=1 Tax=Salix suchowensis TaxID=1278906 RepID=A0ABQ9A2M4_9ROSI|nr:hypothetical protein OIU77_012124 [Salix suchowensis]